MPSPILKEVFGSEPKPEKKVNPIQQFLLNSIGNVLDKVATPQEFEQNKQEEISRYQNLPGDIGSLGKMITRWIDPLKMVKGDILPTPEELGRSGRAVSTLFRPIARVSEPARGMIRETIKQGTPFKSSVLAGGLKGFLMPEKTESITSLIPFSKQEREGGVASLIPRAVLEGIESVLVYGGGTRIIKDISKKIKGANVEGLVNKVENALVAAESKGATFNLPKGLDRKDLARFVVAKGQSDPVFGDFVKQASLAPSEMFAGLPVPEELAKKLGLTPQMLENLGKGIIKDIPKPILGELIRNGIDVSGPAVKKAREEANKIPETININTPERQKLREKIINEEYGEGANLKEGKAVIVLGLPASGKNTYIVEPIAEDIGGKIIDSDIYKEKLPEYNKGIGAAAVHKESSDIIESAILEKAIANNDNIVIPRLDKNVNTMRGIINSLKEAGYKVSLYHASLSPEKAVERANKRFLETGRFVDPDYIKDLGLIPKKNYDILKSEKGVDEYAEWSTDIPKGEEAKLIETSGKPIRLRSRRPRRGLINQSNQERKPPQGKEEKLEEEIPISYKDKLRKEFENLPLEQKLEEAGMAESEIELADLAKTPEGNIYKAIRDLGKMNVWVKGKQPEEYEFLPASLKSKTSSITPDEMYKMLSRYGFQFESENDFLEYLKTSPNPEQKIDREYLNWVIRSAKKSKILRDKGIEAYVKSIEKQTGVLRTKIKTIIREITGQTKVSNLVREDIALEEVLKRENETFKRAYKQGKVEEKYNLLKKIEERDAVKKARRDAIKIIRNIKEIDTSKMSPANKKVIDDIKEAIDITVPSKKTLARLVETRAYLLDNPEANLPDYVLEDIKRLSRLNRSSLTLDDLKKLEMIVKHRVYLERKKVEIRTRQGERRVEQVREKAISELRKTEAKAKGMISKLLGINQDAYSKIIEDLAGEGSTVYDVLFYQVDRAINRQEKLKQELFDLFAEEYRKLGVDIKDIRKFMEEEVKTGRFSLTRPERISLYLHTQNENNLRHLEGGFVLRRDTSKRLNKLSYDELKEILDSLTEDELKIAGLNNIIEDKVYNLINKTFYEMNGYNLPREENYFRIKVSTKHLGHELEEESALEALKRKYVGINLMKGFLNKRIKSKAPIILEDFFVALSGHIYEGVAYAALEKSLFDARKLLYYPKFRSQIDYSYGEGTWNHIEKGLRDIAGDYDILSDYEKAFSIWKNRVTGAIFALNPFIMIKQVLSFPLFNAYVDWDNLLEAMGEYFSNSEQIYNKLKANSPEFRSRTEYGFDRDIADLFKARTADRLAGAEPTIQEKAMSGIRFFDKHTVAIGMWGAIKQKLKELEGSDLSLEDKLKKAYEFAEYVVNRTQPSFALQYRSPMSRGRPLEKILTFATSATNQQYNLIRRLWGKYKRTGDPKDFQSAVRVSLYIMGLIPLGIILLDRIRDRIYGREPSKYAYANIVAGNVYLLKDLVNSATSKIEKGAFLGYDISNPVISMANRVVDGGSYLAQGLMETDEKKRRDKIRKGLDIGFETFLVTKGLPYRTPKRILESLGGKKKEAKKKGGSKILKEVFG